MSSQASATCPRCAAALVTSGIGPDVLLRCAACGGQFALGGKQVAKSAQSIGLKAQLSLVFGLASIVCGVITAIPAVVVGWLALRDIWRERTAAQGKPLAAIGIVTGTVMMVCCTGVVASIAVMAQYVESTQDPAKAKAFAAELGLLDVPEGVWAWRAEKLPLGLMVVKYTSSKQFRDATIKIDLMYYPGWMIQSREAMRQQERTFTNQFRGKTLASEVRLDNSTLKQVKVDDDGQRYRNYCDVIETPSGFIMGMISVKDPHETNEPAEGEWIQFNDDEARAFFKSYRPPSSE